MPSLVQVLVTVMLVTPYRCSHHHGKEIPPPFPPIDDRDKDSGADGKHLANGIRHFAVFSLFFLSFLSFLSLLSFSLSLLSLFSLSLSPFLLFASSFAWSETSETSGACASSGASASTYAKGVHWERKRERAGTQREGRKTVDWGRLQDPRNCRTGTTCRSRGRARGGNTKSCRTNGRGANGVEERLGSFGRRAKQGPDLSASLHGTALTVQNVGGQFCRGPARPYLPGCAPPDLKCAPRTKTLENSLHRGHLTPARGALAESAQDGQCGGVKSAIDTPDYANVVDVLGVEGLTHTERGVTRSTTPSAQCTHTNTRVCSPLCFWLWLQRHPACLCPPGVLALRP